MDEDYARLSWAAGVFAAQADTHLGGEYFATKIRDATWELTREKMAEWKAEAIKMGVPATTFKDVEMPKDLLAAGMAAQKKLDSRFH